MNFVQYSHHGKLVWVELNNIGKHKDFCLCYACKKLNLTSVADNCKIAQSLYEINVKHHITTPVWECPEFEWRKNEN